MAREIIVMVKEEVNNLHKLGCIRVTMYLDWFANVLPFRKKNGKVKVCIDVIDWNATLPKDKYVMPIADKLVDATDIRSYQ